MFEFDEELFNKAYIENSKLVRNFDSDRCIISDVYDISFNYEGKNEVEAILGDLKKTINDVEDLDKQMLKIKALMKKLKNTKGIDLNDLSNESLKKFFCFDSPFAGEYGANQNYPYLLYKMLLQHPENLNDIYKKKVSLIESIFKKYKYADVDNNLIYFSLLAFGNGGCGVSATTNVIIDYYSRKKNGNELFEKKYGFPLYYEDNKGVKHYNYEGMFVKTYLDELHNETNDTPLNFCLNLFGIDTPDRGYIPVIDDVSTYGKSAGKAVGLTPSAISKILKDQLPGDSVNIDKESMGMGMVSMLGITSNWDDVKRSLSNHKGKYDYCIIGAHSFEMRALDNYYIENYNKGSDLYSNFGGHFLLVTDISKNGNPIVSSWGYKFELTNSGQTDLMFINIGD